MSEIPWGRVAVLAGGIVVVRGLMQGASRAMGVVAAEVEYRIGDAWPGSRRGGRA